MVVEMEIEILDGQSSRLFSNEPCEKTPVMPIEIFDCPFPKRQVSKWLSKSKSKSWMVIAGLLSNGPVMIIEDFDFFFEKRSVMTIMDFGFDFDEHFESHFFENGLYHLGMYTSCTH